MSKKAQSARGEVVDFDLLEIKAQNESQPGENNSPPLAITIAPITNFIDDRIRRKIKKVVNTQADQLSIPTEEATA